jgi:TRAP-type C4-dicarboxylate transport system permease large subunit
MVREGWLFLVMLLLALGFITFVPSLVLWLPHSMGYVTGA